MRAAAQWDRLTRVASPTMETWHAELKKMRTAFWQLNNVSIDAYARASYRRLLRAVQTNPLAVAMMDFKRQIESQHRSDFGRPPDEKVGQGLLAMFLNARDIRVRKEVPSGAGRTDIFFLEGGPIIETKLPTSITEYEDGLVELHQYLDNEGVDYRLYVVFADREDTNHTRWMGDRFTSFTINKEGKTIEVFPKT